MSRLSNYSKFDHLDDSDDDQKGASSSAMQKQQEGPAVATPPQASTPQTAAAPPRNMPGAATMMHRKDSKAGRFVFSTSDGQTLYEWEQKVESVSVYVPAPPGVKANDLICTITPLHLKLGMRQAVQTQNAWYFDFDFFDTVQTNESTWYLETGDTTPTICIVLTKAHPGQVWTRVFATEPDMDAASEERLKQELMKERFQVEHAGFDFRDAEFNGSAPDPRSFLGGMPSM